MSRTEAIAVINAQLASLDDERVLTVAGIVADIAAVNTGTIRPLTARELALVEQSKADFAAGRTSSLEESMTYVSAELARRRATRGS